MRLFFLFAVLTFVFISSSSAHSTEIPSDPQLKAAYLYNFAKFIHWPEEAFASVQAPLVIGVLGENPSALDLAPLASKKVRERAIEIQYYKSVTEVQNCHLLYVSPARSKQFHTVLKKFSSRPIITVSDTKNFANQGGVIQFVTRRGRLRFVINLDIAKANNIKIDSQLLSLAVEILEAGK